MSEHFISADDARNDLTSCAAFLAETLTGDNRAAAMAAVLPNYLAKDDVDTAAELANTIDDPYMRDRLLQSVAERCSELGDDEYALQLADAVEEFGTRSQTYEKIAIKKIAAGEIDKALDIAGTLSHPDSVYAAAAAKYALLGDEGSVAQMLERIEYAPEKVYALIGMASAKFDVGDVESAAAALDEAAETAETIDHDEEKLRALRDIGNLFAEIGREHKAILVFEKMSEFAETLDSVNRDGFLAAASVGLQRAGSQEFSDRAFDLIEDKTQIATALLGISREEWRKDEKDAAFESLEESLSVLRSQKESETRDTAAKNALFSSIAIQFAGYGKDERAMEIAQDNEDDGQHLSALAQIAQIAATQGNLDAAKQALNAIFDDAHKIFALIGVSDAVKKNGDDAAALSLLDEANEAAETIPQLASKTSAYVELSTRYDANGQPEKARTAAANAFHSITELRDEANRSAKLAELANVYERCGFELNDEEKEQMMMLVNATFTY